MSWESWFIGFVCGAFVVLVLYLWGESQVGPKF
jgi:hypothetical protein